MILNLAIYLYPKNDREIHEDFYKNINIFFFFTVR